MKLATLFTCAIALIFTALMVLPESADAKRFGGGRSFGKQYKTMPRQAQPPRQASQPKQEQPGRQQAGAGQARPQSGMSRWLGPLAGLAAGGLLASLFFGEGFEGISVMDVILILVLVGGGFLLFRMLRGGRPAPVAAGSGSGPGPSPAPAAMDHQYRESARPETPPAGGFIPAGLGSTPPQAQGNDEFPFWFDGPAFIEGAKQHFIRLQAAWDQADFEGIGEYTTPEMLAELRRERERLDRHQVTEVIRLQSELVTIQREGDKVVAGIRFQGLIREEERGVAEEFSEIWHVVHPWDSPDGDWLISGIQQD